MPVNKYGSSVSYNMFPHIFVGPVTAILIHKEAEPLYALIKMLRNLGLRNDIDSMLVNDLGHKYNRIEEVMLNARIRQIKENFIGIERDTPENRRRLEYEIHLEIESYNRKNRRKMGYRFDR